MMYGLYYTNLYLGSNHQPLSVQLDTGSASLIIPSSSCLACKGASQSYDPSSSDTYEYVPCTSDKCQANTCQNKSCGNPWTLPPLTGSCGATANQCWYYIYIY